MTDTKSEEETSKENKEKKERELAQQTLEIAILSNFPETSIERIAEIDDDSDLQQIYNDWVDEYKQKNPDFKKEDNTITLDERGCGCFISFQDPGAEESFVRALAQNSHHGGITDKGIRIAKFEKGELIDPRTDQAFPEGEYAKLVTQLDKGIAHDKCVDLDGDIPSKPSTAVDYK